MNPSDTPRPARFGPRAATALAALTGVAALALALRGQHPASATLPPPSPAPRVDGDTVVLDAASPRLRSIAAEPARAGHEPPVLTTGRLTWDEDVTSRVFPPVEGRVVRLPYDLGSRVAAGAPLATLSSPDFGSAQSDAARAATDLALAQRTRDREARLVERGAAPRKDLDAAEADVARCRAEADRTSAKLARWGARPGAVDQLFPLASPVAGVVVERNVTPGQEVRPDAAAPLFTVTDPRRLWVLLDLGERDLRRVRPGAPLLLRSAADPSRTFPGTLDVVGDSLDPSTRTVKARGRVANPDGLLKAEMYVTAEVGEREPRAGVVVPARAVLTEGARHVAFVEEGTGRFRRVPVEVGVERDGALFVREGLAPGVRVVTDGSLLLEALLSGGGAG